MSRNEYDRPTEVELTVLFRQVGPKTWVQPSMVCRVQDDQPLAGQDQADVGCTMYMVDETQTYLKGQSAEQTIDYLVGMAIYPGP